MVSATHYPLKAACLGGSESREGKWNAHSKDRGVGGESPNCPCPALGSNRGQVHLMIDLQITPMELNILKGLGVFYINKSYTVWKSKIGEIKEDN